MAPVSSDARVCSWNGGNRKKFNSDAIFDTKNTNEPLGLSCDSHSCFDQTHYFLQNVEPLLYKQVWHLAI